MKVHYLFLLLALAILSGCRTQSLLSTAKGNKEIAPLDPTFYYNAQWEYRIRRDDKINISVWGQDELSVGNVYGIYNSNEVYGKWLMVDLRGEIEVPRIGTLHVEGLTLYEAKQKLRTAFSETLNKPVVDIKVLNKEISVLGEVRNPGVFTVDEDQNSMVEMLARAGGTEFYANLKLVKVLRQAGRDVHMSTIDMSNPVNYLQKNIQLRPGDVVIIPSKNYKEFDKRISVIIPLTNTVTAASIILGLF